MLRTVERSASEEACPRAPVAVVVRAPDPVLRAGAISQLRRQPTIRLVDDVEDGTDAVPVQLMETVDKHHLDPLRTLARRKGMRTVLVATSIRDAALLDVIAGGVRVIVWRRDATGERIGQAVRAACQDVEDMPPDLVGRLVRQVSGLRRGAAVRDGAPPIGLAAREVDVLRLVAEGMGNAEIAAELSYSEHVVKRTLRGVTTRLSLRNSAHAVAYAVREGYI